MQQNMPERTTLQRWTIATTVAAFTLAASISLAAPPPDAAVALVERTTAAMFAQVDKERAAIESNPARARAIIDDVITPHVDLERASRVVLGKHWRRATPDQKVRFTAEFKQLLVRTYTTAVTEYTGVDINYLPVRVSSDKEVTVLTKVRQSSGPEISINYRMYANANAWKVYDVMIGGVSLITTYRSAFSTEVKQHGIDGLIERMANKNRN